MLFGLTCSSLKVDCCMRDCGAKNGRRMLVLAASRHAISFPPCPLDSVEAQQFSG